MPIEPAITTALARALADTRLTGGDVIDTPHIGTDGATLLLDAAGALYLFKAWRDRPIEELVFEAALLKHLRDMAFPAPAPYIWTEQNGHWLAALRPAVQGRHPAHASKSLAHTLGQLLGRLHTGTEGVSLEGRVARPQLLELTFVSEVARELPSLASHAQTLLGAFGAERTLELSRAIIHDDTALENILLGGNDAITIIDWSDAHIDHCVADLGAAIFQLDLGQDDRGELLQGYESVRPLTTDERTILPFLPVRRMFFLLSYYLTKRGSASDAAQRMRYDNEITRLQRCLTGHGGYTR